MSCRKRQRDNPKQLHIEGMEPTPRGYARRKHFTAHPDTAEAAAVIRGALADQLEEAFVNGELRDVLWNGDVPSERTRQFIERVIELAEDRDRVGIWKALQKHGLDVFQAVALALFSELYAADPLAVGLVPASGVERVGVERLKAFAEMLQGAAKSA